METSEASRNGLGRSSQSTSCPDWYLQEVHLQERRKMITNIARLLQARKPNAPVEWMQKLPQMARRLEESLFRSAVSFEEYKDTQTLKRRLQALAMAMGLRAQQQKQKIDESKSVNALAGKASIISASTNLNGNVSNESQIKIREASLQAAKVDTLTTESSGRSEQHKDISADASKHHQQSHEIPANKVDLPQQRSYQSEQRQQVLRQQQQRLLLLRHASKCPHDNGTCPVTQHCAGMKRLWKHIAECKDQQCQTAHCVSSRYVLSHYHRCKDPRCAVCGPVREAIQRNHEKAKHQQQLALKQHDSTNNHHTVSVAPQEPAVMPSASSISQRRSTSRVDGMVNPAFTTTSSDKMKARSGTKRSARNASDYHADAAMIANEVDKASRSNESSSSRMLASASQKEHRSSSRMATVSESLLNSFTPAQIQAHLQSLKTGVRMSASKIRQKCTPVLDKLIEHENSWIFMQPVDPVELNLPDYFDIIKKPMDLGSIRKRMATNSYRVVSHFMADVNLTFDNAITYNGEDSDVSKVAKEMKNTFEKLHHNMMLSIEAEEEQRKSSGDVCILCGCEKLMFEPTVYYCNGSCNGQRIRRNSYYYTGGRNQYHWCQSCYNELKEKEPLEFPDMTLWKKELQKKKNDEMHEESWVECSQCKRWVHQVCALFNGRMNKGTTIYHCPFCFMARRGSGEPQPRPPGAKSIRHSKLSHYLEDRVQKALKEALAENTELSTIRTDIPGALYVRQLSNIDKTHQAKAKLLKQYEDTRYPAEFPVRSKCVMLFQEIDGVDVILFGMYLYEYGHECPQPNQRRVYVSYLDSVYYFRPRKFRTLVYHEMLIAYLAHVKQRGFHTAHLWACPPCKGDDYIFFCHPEDQKTPKDDRLRCWYLSLLKKAKVEGIVTHITNLWDDHFKRDIDVTKVPNFEGDYWPGEAENVLKLIEEEVSVDHDSKSHKSSSTKSKSKGRNTRSDGSIVSKEGQDALVCRMGKTIEPMKEAFIVAYLQPRSLISIMEQQDTGTKKTEKNGSTTKAQDSSSGKTADVVKKPDSEESIAAKNLADAADRTDNDSSENSKDVSLEFGRFINETEDCDDIIESEFFDTRQQFLNLCQGNHYQFDELRRAKHTSMMSLYHIHNPDVPKFTVACSHCGTDINAGMCFNSDKDSEFHLCQDCYASSHKLYLDKAPFRRTNVGGDSQGHLTEEQRRERQRSIQLHMQLLTHASACRNNHCPSANCIKMKNLLKHGATCTVRVQGGCAICRRIWALLQIHARQCRRENCLVPKCRQLKEQFRAVIQQQAQMDERRRVAMNAAYRRG